MEVEGEKETPKADAEAPPKTEETEENAKPEPPSPSEGISFIIFNRNLYQIIIL